MSGCCSTTSGIDPTGEHIFVAPPAPPVAGGRSDEVYRDQPLGQVSWDDVAVELEPRETVASVGSEVVLKAGVCGPDGYLRTNRRLEWSIDPGGVGQFVAVGETGLVDVLLGDFNRPRKITNTFAIGSTLRTNTRLNRGTCIPEENVYVLRGQGWISLTSPVEGTSHVTVFAPDVYRWDSRLKSAMVHWVDAQWRFPPPAINPAGTHHVFTTAVLRQSNQAPCENWRVRYEIVSGPPAGFMPDGATAIEVSTDPAGQASVEIFQKEPRHGTNQICVQVIRPGELPGANGRRLIVGTGTTTKTWTGADLAVKKSGPAVAGLGATLNYRINVSNPGDLPAKDVVATDSVPDGLTYLGSNPAATVVGRQLQWRLGELGARQTQTIDVSFRAEKPGSIASCCEVVAEGGLKVSDCATTTIAVAAPTSLNIDITGPAEASIGSEVTYEIAIRNQGPTPATGLTIIDRLDAGLEHRAADRQNAIKRSLGDLAPGETKRVSVTLRVARAGRLCHTVEVAGPNSAPSSKQVCLNVVGPGAGSSTPSLEQPGPSAPKPAVTVKTTGPKQLGVGELALFSMDITNTGPLALTNVRVVAGWDPALEPSQATEGFKREGDTLIWTIDNLPAGGSNQYRVLYGCRSATAKACSRVSVTTSDGAKVGDGEACLEIRAPAPPPSVLVTPETKPETRSNDDVTVSVVGLTQPVTVGRSVTYEIRVTNNGRTPYQQIKVTATLPESMVPDPLGTAGPEGTKWAIKGKTVTFEPVPELRPGPPLVYYVPAQTRQPGKYQFRAEVTGLGLAPIVKEAFTDVNERSSR